MTFNLQRLLALKDKRAIPPPAAPQASEAEREALFREIRSTLARRELNPLDVSAALSSLLEAGLSQAEIARRVGRSPAYVSTYLELATLPEELERLVREGRLRDPSTVVVLKRLFAESPDEAAAQIRRAMRENGTISRAAARKLLSDACRFSILISFHPDDRGTGSKIHSDNPLYRHHTSSVSLISSSFSFSSSL